MRNANTGKPSIKFAAAADELMKEFADQSVKTDPLLVFLTMAFWGLQCQECDHEKTACRSCRIGYLKRHFKKLSTAYYKTHPKRDAFKEMKEDFEVPIVLASLTSVCLTDFCSHCEESKKGTFCFKDCICKHASPMWASLIFTNMSKSCKRMRGKAQKKTTAKKAKK